MPLLWLSVAFLLGIPLAASLPLGVFAWLGLAAVCILVWLFFKFFIAKLFHSPIYVPLPAFRINPSNPVSRFVQSNSLFRPPISATLLVLVVLIGAARTASTRPQFAPDFVAWYNSGEGEPGRVVTIEGILEKPPDVRDTAVLLTLWSSRLQPGASEAYIPVYGRVLARVLPGGELHYGDRVRVEGELQTPPEDEEFSYRDYLARQGVYAYMPQAQVTRISSNQGNPVLAAVYAFRDNAQSTIYRIFPDPEASLLAGILLGLDNQIPKDLQAAFQATGTAHIIAISGFNISILAAMFGLFFTRLLGASRRYVAFGLTAAIIALYALLVGATPSVVRAALMGGLALFARAVGRRQQGLNTLAFVAAVMALINPQVLWDAGFQLSFTATLGLILFAEPLSEGFVRLASHSIPLPTARRLAGPVGAYFLFTLAAQVLSLPVTMYHFQRLSLVAWVANPVVLPVQPAVMVLGGLAVLAGMLSLPLGRLVGMLAWPFVAFTIRAVELFARIPGGSLALGSFSLLVVLLFYLLVLGWSYFASRFKKAAGALTPSLALFALGSLAVVVWQAAFASPDGRLRVTVLNVGSGDGLLIQTPTGRNLLVDGGPSLRQLSEGLGRRLPLASRALDWLVITASGTEQVGALRGVLDRFQPAGILWAGPPQGTYDSRLLLEAVNEAGLPVTPAESGQAVDLGGGAWLRVLHAGERGAVLLLEWRNFRLLLPGGVDFEAFQALENGRSVGRVTALLLADEGYAPSNPPEWIEMLNPEVILLSVGAADKRGLPSPETLEAVEGYPLLRTDRNGWIHIETDGERMWVEVERK